jgi:hypothetical protein
VAVTLTDWRINFLLCKHAQTGYTKWLGIADFWDEVKILKLADASGSW